MLPWDPGTLHCKNWKVSMPINKENFNFLQLVLLWFTMNYTTIHSTYLICLFTSLPWEDYSEIQALDSTENKWSHSVIATLTQEIKVSATC